MKGHSEEARMLEGLIATIKEAPQKARETGTLLMGEARERAGAARRRAIALRAQNELRAFDASVSALGAVEASLGRARELPVVGTLAPRAEALVHAGQERLAAQPVEGYAELNVKQVMERVPTLSRLDLIRVRHHEQLGKSRKTVLEGIARELARRDVPQA
jgi:hypothetical protein